jgi:plasmid stabilization system protein ParE
MKIIWLRRASVALDGAYDFLAKVSPAAANRLYNDILDRVELLASTPLAAPAERLLEDVPESFRSMVVQKRYKIVYFIEDETVKIADVWDCRRNPATLRENILQEDN